MLTTCHDSGRPFNACPPLSSKAKPLPAVRSFTVRETRTSDGPAMEEIRAPIVTAGPARLPSTIMHSPA